MVTTQRGRGRPKKEPKQGERNPLGLRVTAKLKKDLEAVATKSGRSLSHEIEFRLEQSFTEESAIVRAFGDERSYRLARLLFGTKDLIEAMHERSVFEDYETFLAASVAMEELLERFAPEPGSGFEDRTAKAMIDQQEYAASMKGQANQLAVMVNAPLTPAESAEWEGRRTARMVFAGKLETGFDED